MRDLLPLFVNLSGRRVLLVGGGPVAASKLTQLLATGADISVVAPAVDDQIERAGVHVERRPFSPDDLTGVWLVVAAATPEVNRAVAKAADELNVFVNAVDDPANASAFLGGVVRRDGVTIAISTSGEAPALAGLLREALDALLPRDAAEWIHEARRQRTIWRRGRVPMSRRRPLLLQALNRLYEGSQDSVGSQGAPSGAREDSRSGSAAVGRDSSSAAAGHGHVSLVGAGPGDPGLLTRTAVTRLRAADLVLYDALVDQRVLRLARRAQRFFVGKRAGRHSIAQQQIHALMIRAARRGRRVVRLKGGDPFVFGRGGEEAIALEQAAVPFDVVPGVSSAVAAPALAGIPVTHRGLASALLVVDGHDEQAFARNVAGLKPQAMTLIIMMGLGRRVSLGACLLEQGWSAATPSAIVAEASVPAQEVWRGTLAELADGHGLVSSAGPAVLVVGNVAALDLSGAVTIDSWRPASAGVRG